MFPKFLFKLNIACKKLKYYPVLYRFKALFSGGFMILRVKIKYFAIFREITNKREEELDVKEGATIKELLETLSERYGKRFKDLVFNGDVVSDRLLMLVDGVNIHSLNGLETKLSENATFVILPPVGGGG